MHPDFYRGPAMVKPPVVYIAGLLRARGRGVAERLVVDLRARRPASLPPAERRRLGRLALARHLDLPRPLDRRQRDRRLRRDRRRGLLDAGEKLEDRGAPRAEFWGDPQLRSGDPQGLERYAGAVAAAATADWQQETFRLLRQNALRMLIATSPDMQTC